MNCGKEGYDTYVLARKIARRTVDKAKRTTGRTIHNCEPYHCTHCHQWHVTGFNFTKIKKAA